MRLRVLLVILYRSGLRISEALDLYESDLNHNLRAIMVRHGKGDKSRLVVVDEWGWREIRHGFAVDCSREGIGMYSLQGALGHARLDVTERYLRGIDPMERLAPIAARHAPMIVVPSIRSHARPPDS